MQGKTINGYTLQRLLGKGGMAEVWYAENTLGKNAAVKFLKKELCANPDIVTRFRNEAQVMVKLNHPNIRQVYDYAELDGQPAIIMEYLEGDDLKTRMKRGERFGEQQLEKWWNQMVGALNYTHAKDIVHRDIKPSNIFIDAEDNVRLLDFGIAKIKESISSTQTGSTLGTLLYMSPEQIDDVKRVDYRTDVYSLAVTFVHLLTGKAPYDATTTSDYQIRKSIVEKPLDLTALPVTWSGFLTPYLAKDREQRPALKPFDASAASASGFASSSDEGTVIDTPKKPEPKPQPKPSPTPKEPTGGKPKRTGLWVALAAFAIVGIVIGVSLKPEEEIVNETVEEVVEEDSYDKPLTFTVNGVSFRMLPVEGGTFTMGATAEQGSDARDNEKPTHSVTLSSYYMGETEVTQALWQAVMGTNPSHFSGQNLPVDNVNWFNAVEFCNRLSEIIGLQPYYVIDKDHDDPNDINYNFSLKWSVIVNADANGFRLPTEAEWEYAARGGKNSHGYKYSGSDNLDEVAWHAGNSCGETHTIKTKQPNELGIYDMSGNVWEWCYDWHGAYVSACLTNPLGVTKGKHRICRGGGICPANYNGNYRVSLRGYKHSSLHSMDDGFRLLLR